MVRVLIEKGVSPSYVGGNPIKEDSRYERISREDAFEVGMKVQRSKSLKYVEVTRCFLKRFLHGVARGSLMFFDLII